MIYTNPYRQSLGDNFSGFLPSDSHNVRVPIPCNEATASYIVSIVHDIRTTLAACRSSSQCFLPICHPCTLAHVATSDSSALGPSINEKNFWRRILPSTHMENISVIEVFLIRAKWLTDQASGLASPLPAPFNPTGLEVGFPRHYRWLQGLCQRV